MRLRAQPIQTAGLRCLLLFAVITASPIAAEIPPDHAERMTRGAQTFQSSVRSLLIENCLSCHGGEKTKGGLDLSTREDLLKGGSDGGVIIPFRSRDSRLLKLIRHAEEPHMPDKKAKLPDEAIAKIAAWIDDGAPYDQPLIAGRKPARDKSIVTAEDRDWWAFKPLAAIKPPQTPKRSATGNPIDAFVQTKASEKRLKLASPADQRTLVRRAYLDLLGLPPSPEEVASFLNDKSADAWSRLIDRLLASPHYGERWARHWLDVARFAESSGFEHDYDREGAFHYRDFVIKALNADLPYDQFVRWQMAGDEFEPDNPLALTATGFLGAGVFPTQITANEVERTRYDALDDMLATTGSAFLGLTIGCARCHDHKYDPIPARDYYRMLSTFTTTVRSVIDLDVDPAKTRELKAKWTAERAPLLAELSRYEGTLASKFDAWLGSGAALAEPAAWTLLELTNITSKAGATFKKLEDGSVLAEGPNGDHDEYTLTVPAPLQRITGLRLEALAHASMTKGGPGRAGNGNIGLSRIRIFAVPAKSGVTQEVRIAKAEADFEQNKDNLSVASALDDKASSGWAIDPQFGKDHSAVFTFAEALETQEALTLTVKLEFKVNSKHNIGRPRLAVTADPNPSLKGDILPVKVAELLRQANQPGFSSRLTTGDRTLLFHWWKRRDPGWQQRNARIEEQAKKEPNGKTKVLICGEGYPALRMHTQGADFFKESYFLKRGNADAKDGVATQSFLQVLMRSPEAEQRWAWQAPEGAKFSGRRRSLANWLTDTETGAGALLARVAVNRLWQHHFGQGLVSTPNDFGRTGALPTHPELLDWLASELIRSEWKLKPIHKLMMTSATYLQSCEPDRQKEAVDPDNTLLARRIPRRLEGETIRDSMLAISGSLDATMFGKGTKDERSRRRSIYFTIKRSQLIGSMVAFDQPEPLVSQGSRPTTTVAPQALFILNGPQVREWAEAFAQRVEAGTGRSGDFADLIRHAYLLALARTPTPEERRDAISFLQAQRQSYEAEEKSKPRSLALADLCQVIFGLNEFAYSN